MPSPKTPPSIPIGTRVRILPSGGGLLSGSTLAPGSAGDWLSIRLDADEVGVRPEQAVLVEADLGDRVLWFEAKPTVPAGSDGTAFSVRMPDAATEYREVAPRQSPRFAVQCDVDLTTVDGSLVLRTKAMDLSAGGARIHFDGPIAEGDRLELRLYLGLDPRPLAVRAIVVERLASAMQPGRHVVRLAFDAVDEDASARISQYCVRAQTEPRKRKLND